MGIIAQVHGPKGAKFIAKKVTLSSGAATFTHGLQRAFIVLTPEDPTAIAGETFGVIGVADANGQFQGLSAAIESSNGSSTEIVNCLAIGY